MTNNLPNLPLHWESKLDFVEWLMTEKSLGEVAHFPLDHRQAQNFLFANTREEKWQLTAGGTVWMETKFASWKLQFPHDLSTNNVLRLVKCFPGQPFYLTWARSQLTSVDVFDPRINMEWQLMDYDIHKWLDFRKTS
jgi:hypothetical protein